MAKVKFGMMMTDASGKLGGQVFSKNRSGSYVRTKVTPSNPQTVSQQQSRSYLGSVSSAWSDLTDAQRASFVGAVEDWKKTDIFGDLKRPTGKNLFTSLNVNLLNSGQGNIVSAPAKVEIPYIVFESVEISIAGTSIDIITTTTPVGFVGLVSATPPQSAGTSFYKGKFREIAIVPSDDFPASNLYADYIARFGVPAIGSNIAFSFKLIAPNGQAGVPTVVKATVVA